ncbi:MAG: protein kinase [Rhodospirillaceae bacterium]
MPPTQLEIAAGQITETGKRARNEDYLGLYVPEPGRRSSHGIVAVVADGVSGGKGGREAAELAVREFIGSYYALSATLGVPQSAARAIEGVNRWLHAQGHNDPELEYCATTFTAVILRGRTAHILHVGDSRAYFLSNNQLTCLTRDHTLNHRDLSHVLYRAVGIEAAVRLDHVVQPIRPHDRFLICSDGVHGTLSDRHLHKFLRDGSAPEAVARAIVTAAAAAGSEDNISALVIDVLAVPMADHTELALALAELPTEEPPREGDTVDGFRLDTALSDGRYSRLFKATDTVANRTVVLKFPRPDAIETDACRRGFLREAWVAARVRSPWLGEGIELPPGRQSRLYSVMPYYDGETLEQRLNRAPQPTAAEGVGIAVRLAKAVATLHRAGIIHRDIKPDNIMLTKDGGLRLIDLGVARLPRLEGKPETESPGTPGYMAPELFAGKAADEMSDQFALGVTLYRFFTGAYPYGEIEPFSHPHFGHPVPLITRRRDLPAWLDALIARVIAVEPGERFGDVLEFALQLEHGPTAELSSRYRRLPLYRRNPVRFWQVISFILSIALILALTL